MKKNFLYLLVFALFLNLFCCASEKTGEHETLARINDCDLTLDEFERQLAAEMEWDKYFKLTKKVKKEFLEGLIRKELLIQEAKRLKLDRKEKFVRAIERYWEATLIRDLMEMKGKEICQRIVISQEEIDARYGDMKKSEDKVPALSELQEKIIEDLKEKKKTKMLKEWINNLRKKSRIQINEDLLYKE
ncbi:MAG: SurA N-terminal domain-containing protein [Desulfobacterales bacterium]|nr:SurA N-terminal domain-containing protein [Desulfobacterales bacterium]